MEATTRFCRYLDASGVRYEMIHHARDIHARATAEHTQTPLDAFAKTIFLWVDEAPALAVVPASREVALSKLQKGLDAQTVRKASESEIEELCPGCEVGAAPPFGPLFDLPVYVSRTIADDETITFNGGDHEHAIRMRYKDFEQLVEPEVLRLCKHED